MEDNVMYTFVRRLKKIGIEIELIGNYPWIYLDKVNGVKITEKFEGNHGFTAFWLPVNRDKPITFSDKNKVFAKIREIINAPNIELK